MFCIGDRVIGTGIESGVDITDLVGTVEYADKYNCGVRFDKFNSNFHTLCGRVPRGYGWYCVHEVLAPYNDCPEYPDAPSAVELL